MKGIQIKVLMVNKLAHSKVTLNCSPVLKLVFRTMDWESPKYKWKNTGRVVAI